jgi:hypothetical protein
MTNIYITNSLFGWLVADGWCWFVLREEYCWLVASGWFVLREKYCWLVADKPSEQGENFRDGWGLCNAICSDEKTLSPVDRVVTGLSVDEGV